MRIYSFIDNILIITTIKQIKQKIDFAFFGVRHLGLIITAVAINGFTPVNFMKNMYSECRVVEKISAKAMTVIFVERLAGKYKLGRRC